MALGDGVCAALVAAPLAESYLREVIAALLSAGKVRVLSVSFAAIALIAVADWRVGSRASLGLLYIVPMMLAATVLGPRQTAALAVLCSFLRALFDLPSPHLEVLLRFVFAVAAYRGSGLIVAALSRVRREQDLRRQAEEQLEVLVESSPAAILTTDAAGSVLASNKAADALFLVPGGETLQGRPIGGYIPLLADALKVDAGSEGLRTAAQCQGRRTNGEIFVAQTWFSSYLTPEGRRLAAIIVDSSEEMRDREEEGLRQLMKGNRIAAAAVSHEVRNLSGAISLVCSNLRERHQLSQDADFEGLTNLVDGLERIASCELYGRAHEALGEVALQEVLDDLRIMIEPDWHEIGGSVRWQLPAATPVVLGERHGLLQAFLNLAQNSHRAVLESAVRQWR